MRSIISATILLSALTVYATPRPPVLWFDVQLRERGVKIEVDNASNIFGGPTDDFLINVIWTPPAALLERAPNPEISVSHFVVTDSGERAGATWFSKPNRDGTINAQFEITPSDVGSVFLSFGDRQNPEFIVDLRKYLKHNPKTEQDAAGQPATHPLLK